MTTKYDALEALATKGRAVHGVTRYSESSGEGGGVYEDDEGDYIKLADADEAVIVLHRSLIADVKALRIADKFCGSLTAEECPDSVHIPIRDALKRIQGKA